MSELVSNGVQIYQFPTDDEAVSEINASMNVGSPSEQTPWKRSTVVFVFFLMLINMLELQAWWHFYLQSNPTI